MASSSNPSVKKSIPAPLDNARKKQLRAIGHGLKPVVTVAGNGLSEGVLNEIDRALSDHELIKIKLAVGERDAKQQVVEAICQQQHCLLVQQIGNTALLLREAKQPNPKLSNLQR